MGRRRVSHVGRSAPPKSMTNAVGRRSSWLSAVTCLTKFAVGSSSRMESSSPSGLLAGASSAPMLLASSFSELVVESGLETVDSVVASPIHSR